MKHGFAKKILAQKLPFDSRGQVGYQKGNRIITRDVDAHNSSGFKMYDQRGRRIGTYDANLNFIKY